MKRRCKIIMAVSAGILIATDIASARQQNSRKKVPRWVSEKGYWVIQSNVNTPLAHTILFYDNKNRLMATQDVSGKRLNISRRKTKMELKKKLEAVLQTSSGIREQEQIVISSIPY